GRRGSRRCRWQRQRASPRAGGPGRPPERGSCLVTPVAWGLAATSPPEGLPGLPRLEDGGDAQEDAPHGHAQGGPRIAEAWNPRVGPEPGGPGQGGAVVSKNRQEDQDQSIVEKLDAQPDLLRQEVHEQVHRRVPVVAEGGVSRQEDSPSEEEGGELHPPRDGVPDVPGEGGEEDDG